MGSWFGGHLAINGQNVQLLTTNRSHIDAVQRDGLELRSGPSSMSVQLPIGEPAKFNGPVDLVIVLTKTFQLEAALSSLEGVFDPDTTVLSFQNGLGNAEVIAKHVGQDNTWIGMTMLPVDRIAPGIVEGKGLGASWFGHAYKNRPEKAARLEGLFTDAGMDVRFDANIKSRVWEKVAFNAGMNALCALTHATPGIINRSAEVKQLVKNTAAEAVAVASSMGVDVSLSAVFDTIDYACAHHPEHIPSMLQDLLSGKRTEIDAINGAIAGYAEIEGVPSPLNSQWAALIRLAEQGHSASRPPV